VQKRTRQLTLSAMFVALSVLFPIFFHSIGLGSIFMPMFWPIAAAAFFLSMPLALAVSLLSPLLSSLTTGMPPISPPILHVMVLELSALAATIQWLHQKRGWSVLISLFAGLVTSRFILFIIVLVAAPLLGLPPKIFSIAMVVKGLPGMVIMLILVPVIVGRIRNEPFLISKKPHVHRASTLF
jgi:hypothetical protein